MTFRIIGLSGRMGVGKNTVANYLVAKHGYADLAFATPLKEAAAAIFGFNREQLHGKLKEVVDPFWEMTPRKVLQLLGTDCVRKVIRDDVWVKRAQQCVDETRKRYQAMYVDDVAAIQMGITFDAVGFVPKGIVVTDCRFSDEAYAIQQWGGEMWRLDRPGFSSKDGDRKDLHVSETALDNWNGFKKVLVNNIGTVEAMKSLVDAAMTIQHGDEGMFMNHHAVWPYREAP